MTESYVIDTEKENKEIVKRYQGILKAFNRPLSDEDATMIRRAFELSVHSHKDMRRRSGEPYVYHPLDVARIVVEDIGLGPTAVVCALLHDVVEDTEVSLDDIERLFTPHIAKIIDGLTKIDFIFDQNISIQAENFKKMLLTMNDDVRVILIKLADRLHNMRTLDSMPSDKQLKIASETTYLYAPLAHRLGLFQIKSELEDLSLKYTDPDIYNEIAQKIIRTAPAREQTIREFIAPIEERLKETTLNFSITGRIKSINSIWGKMRKKEIPFEEVYDLFAVRIVLDSPESKEKAHCWKVYSILSEIYRPNPERLRDWISTPKSNGYEALHTTLFFPKGQWVEVQIRSKRMDEIAEKGYAAHWKYKQDTNSSYQDSGLEAWLNKVRETLAQDNKDAVDFINDFRQDLYTDEIVVYTPKGDFRNMPVGSTVLDFAYSIHTELGNTVIGAKVGHNLVPISYVLKSGNQVEVISSKRQKPTEEWLNIATTARAKTIIRQVLKEEKHRHYEEGTAKLNSYLKDIGRDFDQATVSTILEKLGLKAKVELYYAIATDRITKEEIQAVFARSDRSQLWIKRLLPTFGSRKPTEPIDLNEAIQQQVKEKPETLILDQNTANLHYQISSCCNPIPGDDVIGIFMPNNAIQIHRTNCSEAIALMSRLGNRIVKAKWKENEKVSFLTGIKLRGYDRPGIWRDVSSAISNEQNVNIRSVQMQAAEGVFEGTLMIYINDVEHLQLLIEKLKKIDDIDDASRMK